MTTPTPDDIAGLAAKLDGLDLTDTEASILRGILQRAAETDEVTGFGYEATVATGGFAPLLGRIKVKFPTLDTKPEAKG